jgi:hypothetical protein
MDLEMFLRGIEQILVLLVMRWVVLELLGLVSHCLFILSPIVPLVLEKDII